MTMTIKSAWRLAHENCGSTTSEFAIIILPLMMFVTGGLEYGWRAFALSVLHGEIDRAARSSETETVGNQEIDTKLKTTLSSFANANDIDIKREAYQDFGHVRAETLTSDANGNGKWDLGDCYIDSNKNTHWDESLGVAGRGGAQDVVRYTVKMTYPAITPMSAVIGGSSTVTLTASTLVKNQPFAGQTSYNYLDSGAPRCTS
jgi:Flp pilus assembly protein TadG